MRSLAYGRDSARNCSNSPTTEDPHLFTACQRAEKRRRRLPASSTSHPLRSSTVGTVYKTDYMSPTGYQVVDARDRAHSDGQWSGRRHPCSSTREAPKAPQIRLLAEHTWTLSSRPADTSVRESVVFHSADLPPSPPVTLPFWGASPEPPAGTEPTPARLSHSGVWRPSSS